VEHQICPLLVGKVPRDLKLTTRLHVKVRLRMNGTIPPFTSIRQFCEIHVGVYDKISRLTLHSLICVYTNVSCHSSVGARSYCEANFILSLVYITVFGTLLTLIYLHTHSVISLQLCATGSRKLVSAIVQYNPGIHTAFSKKCPNIQSTGKLTVTRFTVAVSCKLVVLNVSRKT
jgi:hypothetical protein